MYLSIAPPLLWKLWRQESYLHCSTCYPLGLVYVANILLKKNVSMILSQPLFSLIMAYLVFFKHFQSVESQKFHCNSGWFVTVFLFLSLLIYWYFQWSSFSLVQYHVIASFLLHFENRWLYINKKHNHYYIMGVWMMSHQA